MQNTRRQTLKTGSNRSSAEDSTFSSIVRPLPGRGNSGTSRGIVGSGSKNAPAIPTTAAVASSGPGSFSAVSGAPGGMGTSVTDAQRAAWAPQRYEDFPPVGQGGHSSSPEYSQGYDDGGTAEGVGQQGYGSVVQGVRGDQATGGQYGGYGDGGGYLPLGQQQQPVRALCSCWFGVCALRRLW